MKKDAGIYWLLGLLPVLLTGCAGGEKGENLTAVYGVMAALALLLLMVYCFTTPKKELWFLLLFVSVFVVNSGYLALALSRNLEEALMANRLAYLGSVFLPLFMWMIIAGVSKIHYPKWLPGVLFAVSILVFLVAASPGYLTVYYKEVYFSKVGGVTVLTKVYGPLHGIYLVYLLGYFGAMVATIVHATLRDKIVYTAYGVILTIAVFVNIIVWAIEQMVSIDFEILSVSYIISESFLLGLCFLMAESEKYTAAQQLPVSPERLVPEEMEEQLKLFEEGLSQLTPKEQEIYDCYLAGMSTAEILEALHIKENTLKFHNKNLYGKLGVSSRKQMLRLAAMTRHRPANKAE